MRIFIGQEDFLYIFYTWGIKANLVLAILWFGIIFCVIIPFDVAPWLEIVLFSPLFIWTLGYLPVFLFILIRTKTNSTYEILLKIITIIATTGGILTGIFWAWVAKFGWV